MVFINEHVELCWGTQLTPIKRHKQALQLFLFYWGRDAGSSWSTRFPNPFLQRCRAWTASGWLLRSRSSCGPSPWWSNSCSRFFYSLPTSVAASHDRLDPLSRKADVSRLRPVSGAGHSHWNQWKSYFSPLDMVHLGNVATVAYTGHRWLITGLFSGVCHSLKAVSPCEHCATG